MKLSSKSNIAASAIGAPARHAEEAWLRSGHLLATGAFLAAIALLIALLFVQFERNAQRLRTTAELQQLAKGMEKQTGISLDAVHGMLRVLANSENSLINGAAPGHIDPILAGIVRGFPQLRSVSVVDDSGHVLASTTAGNLGHVTDLDALGAIPAEQSKVNVGHMLNGRDLTDLQRTGVSAAAKSNIFPMVVRLNDSSGTGKLLVALINADYFSTQYESTTTDKRTRVVLTDFEGKLLVGTNNVNHASGTSLVHLPVFSEYLPRRESGSYLGAGLEDSHAFVAFSALRHWPMVLVVEYSYQNAMETVTVIEKWVSMLLVFTWLVIALLTYTTSRNLARHAVRNLQLRKEVYSSEVRSNAVLESSPDGVITIDSKGQIITFNPAAERMFGRSKIDCIGHAMDELLVPEGLRQAHHDGINRFCVSQDGPALQRLNRRIETVALHSDGSLFPIELSIVSVDVGGQLFFTSNVRDISAQKVAAQQWIDMLVKYHEVAGDLEQQKLALDQHAIVSIVDADETIIYANDKLIEVSGYTREELLGKKLYEFRNRLAPEVYEQMRECLATGNIWHGELHMRHRDGSSYWVTSTSVPAFTDAGKVRQYITIQTDVTNFRKAEIALSEAHARELNIGNRIQQSLLAAAPQNSLPGLWMSHFNQASKGIDGDFIDIIQLGNGCVDFVVGDVMGKGVPAALLGAATKLQFSRSLAELLAQTGRNGLLPEPQAIVSAVHQVMTPHLQALDSFVTLAYIRIDLERNLITWVGCGHEESLLVRENGESMLMPNQQPPLGILDNSEYLQGQAPMANNDFVFLCSDGLPDAIASDGEHLGRDRVNKTLRHLLGEHPTPTAALHSLRRELLHSTVQINDDVSIALIKRPMEGTADTRFELPIDLQSLGSLRNFVLIQALRAGMSEPDAAMFELACVEVFTNIVRHGAGLLPGAPMEIMVRHTTKNCVLDVIHLGDAFTPPLDALEPDLSTFPEGGFGMTIIRSACSNVEFLHHEGVNTVRMTRVLTT